jgi:hypothetical protein
MAGLTRASNCKVAFIGLSTLLSIYRRLTEIKVAIKTVGGALAVDFRRMAQRNFICMRLLHDGETKSHSVGVVQNQPIKSLRHPMAKLERIQLHAGGSR